MRGRPIKSQIRQNIVEILYSLGSAYAYDIYKHYVEIFPKCTLRSIYYHLSKGTDTNEFVISKIVQEKGDYSWGPKAEKIYYSLGPNADPKALNVVRKYFEKHPKLKNLKQNMD